MIFFLFLILAFTTVIVWPSPVLVPLDAQYPALAQPNSNYSWAFSPVTFGPCNHFTYTASFMPGWMHFDPPSRAFYGVPQHDEPDGCVEVAVTARGCGISSSSTFSACVVHRSPITVVMSAETQLKNSNPSVSSVYPLAPNSSLETGQPTLRVPERWSFSVGFSYNTYQSSCSIFYGGLQADASPLPDWLVFDSEAITFNGVAPHGLVGPLTIPLALVASCEKHFREVEFFFNLVVATHELSVLSPNDAIHFMTGSSSGIQLSSSQFSHVLVDQKPIESSNIASLSVNVSAYHWLTFVDNGDNWALTGQPPTNQNIDEMLYLPAKISTHFNQSINTTIPLALSEAYFSVESLPGLIVAEDRRVHFNMSPFIAKDAYGHTQNHIDVDVSFNPAEAAEYLAFDTATDILSGTLPSSWSVRETNVTFTAQSSPHSTSRAILHVTLSSTDHQSYDAPHSSTSAKSHRKLALGLGVTFGVVGGFCCLGLFLATCRRCARVDDTAIVGEEGRKGLSEKDKKWYGLPHFADEKGSDMVDGLTQDREYSYGPTLSTPNRSRPKYGNIGLGLHHVMDRSTYRGSGTQSPGVMSKREFMTRIKETVRTVSDRYARTRRGPDPIVTNRPVIGMPVLVQALPRGNLPSRDDVATDPFTDATALAQVSPTHTMKSANAVHFVDSKLPRHQSSSSIESLGSVRTYGEEAVVRTASRVLSVNSGRSVKVMSQQLIGDISPRVSGPRPRIVPFKSVNRVPQPHMSSDSTRAGDGILSSVRITSQTALPLDVEVEDIDGSIPPSSDDELAISLRYVDALGVEAPTNTAISTLTVSTNVHSSESFSSLESSRHGHATSGNTVRILARTGEQFRFRIPIPQKFSSRSRKLMARLASGRSLPIFLHVDLEARSNNGTVEFYGVPALNDIGRLDIQVYTDGDDECQVRIRLDVVSRPRA